MKKILKNSKKNRDKKKLERRIFFKAFKTKKNRRLNSLTKKDKQRRLIIEEQRRKLINELNKYQDYSNVQAPKILSLIENPTGTIKFINKLRNSFNNLEKVFVDLSNVIEIKHDAIVILLAVMIRFKSKNIPFNGNFPKVIKARNILIDSDFFNHFNMSFTDKAQYYIGKKDLIVTHGSLTVDGVLANDLLIEASKTINGSAKYAKGAYRVLLEIMHNTVSHAKGKTTDEEKHWWLSINHDPLKKIVMVSFIDFGIGVFNSLINSPQNSKWFKGVESFKNYLNLDQNEVFFKKILEGEIHASVTGFHYRGKGIPGVNQVFNRGQIKNLSILTNNVCYNGEKNEIKKINDWLEGTFYYFELNEDCYEKG